MREPRKMRLGTKHKSSSDGRKLGEQSTFTQIDNNKKQLLAQFRKTR